MRYSTGISFSPDNTLWFCDATTDTIYNSKILPVSNYLFISGHNLNTIGATITFQYSNDNFSADINDAVTFVPSNNKTFVLEFTTIEQRYSRLKISGQLAAPSMSICYWGNKTELDYASISFDPYGEKVAANVKVTQGGVLSGEHVKHSNRDIDLTFNDADETLYRKVRALWEDVGLENFGLGWEMTEHVLDVYLLRLAPTFKNPLTKGGIYRNIKLSLEGRKE